MVKKISGWLTCQIPDTGYRFFFYPCTTNFAEAIVCFLKKPYGKMKINQKRQFQNLTDKERNVDIISTKSR